MSAPTVLVIVIKAAELSSPTTAAMLRTASDVLGPSTTVRLEATAGSLHTSQRTKESTEYARILVDWEDPQHCVSLLHGYLPGSSHSLDRSITFAESDPPAERGRTLGFVISAMFSNIAAPTVPRAAPHEALPIPPAPANPRLWAASIAAVAAGIGDADSFGAMTRLDYGTSWFRAGVLVGARFGAIPHAQSSTRFIDLGLAGDLRLFPRRGATWFGPALFVGATHLAVTHLSDDDAAPIEQTTWMPLVALSGRITHELSAHTWLFLEAGPECRFGSVNVYVRGEAKARIPATVAALRIGLLARF